VKNSGRRIWVEVLPPRHQDTKVQRAKGNQESVRRFDVAHRRQAEDRFSPRLLFNVSPLGASSPWGQANRREDYKGRRE